MASSSSSPSSSAASMPSSSSSSTKKRLPAQPFRFQLHYGEGAWSADDSAPTSDTQPLPQRAAAGAGADASSSSTPFSLFDCSASTPDMPCIPPASSLLQVRLRFLLHPSHKRGDVGSFVSSMRALQVAFHHLIGWRVWQLRGEAGARSVRGVSYPELHVHVWANPSLPSNLQLVGAQRALLARLPPQLAHAFGQREMPDLIRAAVQSVYLSHGLPTHHEGAQGRAAAEQADRFTAVIGVQFPETLAQLLAVLQEALTSRKPEDDTGGSALLEAFTRACGPLAQMPDEAASAGLSALAAMVPSSKDASATASSASSAPLLQFDLRLPLLPQLGRPLQATLSLLKKSVAYVSCVEMQLQAGESMGSFSHQRHARLQMEGADFASIYAFLQHGLVTETPASAAAAESTSTAAPASPPASSTSVFRRLAGLSLFAEWLGILHTLPHPPVTQE